MPVTEKTFHIRSIRPGADPAFCQIFPREHRARVQFALRRDITVPHHILRGNVMPRYHILCQFYNQVYLRSLIRHPALPDRHFHSARIDNFHADRAFIQAVFPAPVTFSRMPGFIAFRHQLQYHRFTVTHRRDCRHQILNTHSTGSQHTQRCLIIQCGIMENQIIIQFG